MSPTGLKQIPEALTPTSRWFGTSPVGSWGTRVTFEEGRHRVDLCILTAVCRPARTPYELSAQMTTGSALTSRETLQHHPKWSPVAYGLGSHWPGVTCSASSMCLCAWSWDGMVGTGPKAFVHRSLHCWVPGKTSVHSFAQSPTHLCVGSLQSYLSSTILCQTFW